VSVRGYLRDVQEKPSAVRAPVRRVRRFDTAAAAGSAQARGETLDQVLDRNLAELLQELRVAITGVQILFAFLLGLAFTARFASLDRFEVAVYLVALLSTALATIVLIAPVSFHRLVFRRRQKAALVAVADRLLMTGLGVLVVAISSAVLLILDVVAGRWPGLLCGGLTALIGLLTWYVLPLWARRNGLGLAPGVPEEDPAGQG
jgi:O-antigen/teichoic acid export membrane protein